jgi:hypothetical protein
VGSREQGFKGAFPWLFTARPPRCLAAIPLGKLREAEAILRTNVVHNFSYYHRHRICSSSNIQQTRRARPFVCWCQGYQGSKTTSPAARRSSLTILRLDTACIPATRMNGRTFGNNAEAAASRPSTTTCDETIPASWAEGIRRRLSRLKNWPTRYSFRTWLDPASGGRASGYTVPASCLQPGLNPFRIGPASLCLHLVPTGCTYLLF